MDLASLRTLFHHTQVKQWVMSIYDGRREFGAGYNRHTTTFSAKSLSFVYPDIAGSTDESPRVAVYSACL
jgi:hypothetical protein